MRVLVIPDIHLKPNILYRAGALLDQGLADIAVCLMDIPDDWRMQFSVDKYVETFDAVIEFAKSYPNTKWCYGNHDVCYLWNERESGYSYAAASTVCMKLEELKQVVSATSSIQFVQKIDHVLFAHGGISQYFVDEFVDVKDKTDVDAVVAAINALDHPVMWNDASPIWYRPQDYSGGLYQEKQLLQVVGHTPVEKLERVGNLISCDLFSTYMDGSPIGTQEFAVIDTVTWEYKGVK